MCVQYDARLALLPSIQRIHPQPSNVVDGRCGLPFRIGWFNGLPTSVDDLDGMIGEREQIEAKPGGAAPHEGSGILPDDFVVVIRNELHFVVASDCGTLSAESCVRGLTETSAIVSLYVQMLPTGPKFIRRQGRTSLNEIDTRNRNGFSIVPST